MKLTLTIPFALMVALAATACSSTDEEVNGPACLAEASAPEPDTVLSANVSGNPMVGGEHTAYDGISFGGSDQQLHVGGSTGASSFDQQVVITVMGVTGPGTFPLESTGGPGIGIATYWCHTGTPSFALNLPGDSIWVTTFDTATGVVEGEFTFHAKRYRGRDTVAVTDGHFQGVAIKY